MARRAFRFRSLGTQLAVLYAGLFALTMIAVSGLLYLMVDQIGGREVEQQMAASSAVYERLWRQRAGEMQASASLLARDFGFREAVATGDSATASSALANLQGRRRADLAAIVGTDGSVVGALDSAAKGDVARLWDALDGGTLAGVAQIGGRPRQIAAAPIMAPVLSGWVVFATDIDQREMRGLERMSAIPLHAGVIVANGRGATWHRAAGAFDLPGRAAQAQIGRSLDAKKSVSLTLGNEPTIAFATPLPTMVEGERAALLLYSPRALAIAAYRPVQAAVGVVGLLGILLVVFAAWRSARRITEPLERLDRAAGRLAEGERVVLAVRGDDELARLAQGFNHMARQIEEREKRITQLAFNDVLTGLANRAMFQRHVDHLLAARAGQPTIAAIHCLDLDQFKSVNDSLGHAAGDALLVEIGKRLTDAASGCFVARLGGDEFVVVQPIEGPRDAVEKLAARLLEVVSRPLSIDGHRIVPSTSIGVAIAPDDGAEVATLMKNGDLALNRAKTDGRGMTSFFEQSLNQRAQERRQIESDLGEAIERGEFELYFQPLFDLDNRSVSSFEALIRWNHPTRGLVSPVEFIPVAEDNGMIVPIGAWVMREACRHAAGWPEQLRIAVNVSSVQFHRPGLGEEIVRALASSGLAPHRLEVEITESVFLDGGEATLRQLHALRSLGIRIALDDFGTGYSSLSYLQSFPFDKLKIDRSFIQALITKPNASAVVRAITDLARALGMETTAEGVEQSEQLDQLIAYGCSSVQGFLLSRPLRANAVAELLANESAANPTAARSA